MAQPSAGDHAACDATSLLLMRDQLVWSGIALRTAVRPELRVRDAIRSMAASRRAAPLLCRGEFFGAPSPRDRGVSRWRL